MVKEPVSWAPPSYPPTTIDNDGTNVTRYDVRKTLSYVTSDRNNVNNVFMLLWITTEDGKKYHFTRNCGHYGSELIGTILSMNDFQTGKSRGATILEPGSASNERLNTQCRTQTIVAPETGDNWTDTRLTMDLVGIQLDFTVQPTGGNFYYGGGGGIRLSPRGPDPDYTTAVPAWSWYWANPTTRLKGTLTVDGKTANIDSEKSYGLFERQWGNFNCVEGYYALWFYLETGEVLICWVMEPTLEGKPKTNIAFASVWHPNGLHEMIPVGSDTGASDIHTSSETGHKYFNKFFLDLPARNASFNFEVWFRDAEVVPKLAEQRDKYIAIFESYGEGTGLWNGKEIKLQGHAEQLSTLM